MRPLTVLLTCCLLLSLPAPAQPGVSGPTSAVTSQTAPEQPAGDEPIRIELPGGIALDLQVTFGEVQNLTPESLGLAVELIDPLDLIDIILRLPDPLVGTPPGFPVLITIQPPVDGGLAFKGVASVELHTHDLVYLAATPLRLFAAPDGGVFQDITSQMGVGSYRVRGTKGGFSEFLVVTDERPLTTVSVDKFDRLEQLLSARMELIDPLVFADLDASLTTARALYDGGDVGGAIAEVETFGDLVLIHSDAGIPDGWRAQRDKVNVAGQLRAGAATLRFSLVLEDNLLP